MRKAISASILLAAAGTANAQVLVNTGFEAAEGYATGALVGQNGWIGYGNSTTTTTGGTFQVVNNASNARSGSQYVSINSANFSADSAATTFRYRAAYLDESGGPQFTAGFTGKVHMVVSMRASTPVGTRVATNYQLIDLACYDPITFAETDIITFGLYAPSTNVLNSRVVIFGDSSAGSTSGVVISNGTTTAGGTNSWLNSWWDFDVTADWATGKWSLSVNGSSLDSIIDSLTFMNRNFTTSNLFGDADFIAERDRGTANSAGGMEMRYDNLGIEVIVPTPGATALVGLAGLLGARRRRR